MFITNKKLTAEGKVLIRVIKSKMGFVPPHFELFAKLNPKRLKMYLVELEYISNHPNIDADFFTFIRFTIASREGFSYCINLNTKILESRGYSKEHLRKVVQNLKLPLDSAHQALFSSTIEAMVKPDKFNKESIEKLENLNWSSEDIWDALDHGAFLYKYYKILRAYSS